MEIDICIPTYNSAEYLKICLDSIAKNSRFKRNIYVHDNGSTDDTQELLKKYSYVNTTQTKTNEGFCGVNYAIKSGKSEFVYILNCDMFCLPGYDVAIMKQLMEFKKHNINKFTISSCLIEPVGNNPEYTISYHGHDVASFNEHSLLEFYSKNSKIIEKQNTIQFSHPILVPRSSLEEVGFFDVNYYPGYTSDYDLAKSLHTKGTKHFVMLGNSRVYHFSSATFKKLDQCVKNRNGHDVFIKKWNQHPEEFRKQINVKSVFVL